MSSTQSLPPITQISPTDNEAIAKFTGVVCSAFEKMPLMPAFIVEQDNIPPPYPAELSYTRRLEHFETGIRLLAKSGAVLVHTADWAAVAMWLAPDFSGPGFGEARKHRSALTNELGAKITTVEHRVLAISPDEKESKLRPAWHLQFLARNRDVSPSDAVPGAVSAVIRPFLSKAVDVDFVPAYLEATNAYNVSIYKHYGFRVVEEVVVGKGRIGTDGWPKDGGEGVSIWIMIFDAHLPLDERRD